MTKPNYYLKNLKTPDRVKKQMYQASLQHKCEAIKCKLSMTEETLEKIKPKIKSKLEYTNPTRFRKEEEKPKIKPALTV